MSSISINNMNDDDNGKRNKKNNPIDRQLFNQERKKVFQHSSFFEGSNTKVNLVFLVLPKRVHVGTITKHIDVIQLVFFVLIIFAFSFKILLNIIFQQYAMFFVHKPFTRKTNLPS